MLRAARRPLRRVSRTILPPVLARSAALSSLSASTNSSPASSPSWVLAAFILLGAGMGLEERISRSQRISAMAAAARAKRSREEGVTEPQGAFVGTKSLRKFLTGRIEDDYEFNETLGEGGYGTVHSARNFSSGRRVAVKKIPKNRMKSHEFSQEVSALKAIHDLGGHPCIAGVEAMYEDAKHYFLVEELVEGGEMFEHLCENGAYSEAKAAMLLRDLALGLDFLHSNDLVHADLKPENLMLSSWNIDDARVKLVDFGCCGARNSPSPQSVGTMAYWPPEALESYARGETIQLTPELDCWAAGVVLFIMLTGTHPFDPDGRTSEKEILRRAVHESVPLDDETCSHLTSSAKDLIGRLCTKDPAKRMTAREMILHPWVRGISANEEVMSGSDQKLGRFQAALKHRLETGVFCMLMQQQRLSSSGSSSEGAEVGEAIDVLKKAFEAFDVEKKGFVNASDIARVLSESGEEGLTSTEKEELAQGTADINVSTFEALMAELGSVEYTMGDYVFKQGDQGDFLYFLNSGRVDIILENGAKHQRLTSLGAGDFFGEAALLSNKPRSASVKCITPCKLTRISKSSLDRMMKSAKSASANLREVDLMRQISRAKSVLQAVAGVTHHTIAPGAAAVTQGEEGQSMYSVVRGTLDVCINQDEGPSKIVASLSAGDVFGEMSLLLRQPRSATVICRGDCTPGSSKMGPCVINETSADAFMKLLTRSPELGSSLKSLASIRDFRQHMIKLGGGSGANLQREMKKAFDMVDTSGNGRLELDELKAALRKLGSKLTDEDVAMLLETVDLARDGSISFEEFTRMMRW